MSDTNTQENTKKLESDSGDSDAKSDSAKEQLGQEAEEYNSIKEKAVVPKRVWQNHFKWLFTKIQVHSANAWEKADLGDTERKNKFLRLMGAGKFEGSGSSEGDIKPDKGQLLDICSEKEHHGRFVIGDHKPENNRSTSDPDKLQNQLEDQYEQSMQHRLASGRRGHIGLGFQDTDKATEQESDTMVESNDFERQSDVPGDQEEIKQNNGDQDREARDRPDREARDRPDREARDRPSREARDRPDREARDRPDREARDRPSREARDRPDREARDRPDREARGRPSREAKDRPDREARDRSDREAKDKPDREARDRPDREARDRPDREARDRPDRGARDRPDREARDRPDREARDRPDREARDRPDREARGRPSREANDGPDRKRISTGDCTIDKVTDEKKMKFAKSSN